MENEYIIINKTKLLNRIEELEKLESSTDRIIYADKYYTKKAELKEILSKSIPLIPEIEKAFDSGNKRGWSGYPNTDNWTMPTKEDYIDNLKLEI